jgi:hypothetical protein
MGPKAIFASSRHLVGEGGDKVAVANRFAAAILSDGPVRELFSDQVGVARS